jgi:transposase
MNIQQSKSPLRIIKAWYFGQGFLLRVYLWRRSPCKENLTLNPFDLKEDRKNNGRH